jgi:hypothetical protein
MKPLHYFVGSDPHVRAEGRRVAGVDLLTNNAVVQYLERNGPWDGYVSLGDVYDLNVISDHNKGKLKLVEGQRLEADYAAAAGYLTQHWTAAGCPRQFHLLEGNHENRVARYLEARPELEGFLNLPLHLPQFVNYHPFWSTNKPLKIGKATFIHGIGTSSRQVGQGLVDYGTNVFMGHSHRRELKSLRHHGPDETKVAESLPCLCNYDQGYNKGRPSAWQQGFAEFWFWPNGNFNYYVVSIFDHRFIGPDGRLYDGKRGRPETKLEM